VIKHNFDQLKFDQVIVFPKMALLGNLINLPDMDFN
jgi:hypothetical protein